MWNQSAAVECAVGFRLRHNHWPTAVSVLPHWHASDAHTRFLQCVCESMREGESCPQQFLHSLVTAVPYRPDNDDVCGLMKQENYLNGVLVNGRWQSASLVGLLECSLATMIQLMVYYFSVDSIQELSTGSSDVTDGMQPRPSVAVSYVWEDLIIQHNLILQWGTLLLLKPPSVICYHLHDHPILGWSGLTSQEIKAGF